VFVRRHPNSNPHNGRDITVERQFPEYHRHLQHLIRKLHTEIPEPMRGFGQLHRSSLEGGTLEQRTKELIALGIAIAVRCDGCIAYHVHDAIGAGASRAEMLETIGVAVMMGGGPALMYGAEALEAIEQFAASDQTA
jgi:AhpD family alkylhydroperoxidase